MTSGRIMRFDDVGAQQQTKVEIGRFVLTSVLKPGFFRPLRRDFTYEERRWRESNPCRVSGILVLAQILAQAAAPLSNLRDRSHSPRQTYTSGVFSQVTLNQMLFRRRKPLREF